MKKKLQIQTANFANSEINSQVPPVSLKAELTALRLPKYGDQLIISSFIPSFHPLSLPIVFFHQWAHGTASDSAHGVKEVRAILEYQGFSDTR